MRPNLHTSSARGRVRELVRLGVVAGGFVGHNREVELVPNATTGELHGRSLPVFRVTPRQLVADSIAGFTSSSHE